MRETPCATMGRMPSWNIHTAHVEGLLAEESAARLGIRDANAFLFGNMVPDIYVGYVVPDVSHKIKYRTTHFADPSHVPAPNAALFYRRYVRGAQAQGEEPSDLTLGAWAHLLCDHYYNLRTNEYIARVGVEPSEHTRIRKQADFDAFGRTFGISRTCACTPELVAMAAAFPQYPIDEPDVEATIRAHAAIVRRNAEAHIAGTPSYCLLSPAFFHEVYGEVRGVLREALDLHASGGDPTCFGHVEGGDES